ncbi:DUF5959 family protein [Actinomadura livida]|uniref:Uncharacterized protein n=1 Tax=Actinomadura livida TaxID=79909 RepID=A0A7W7MXM3_9ACTN|nr:MULTISPECIES: DUF5959 family protein [Actinomadura]MBB4774034.1 hypothetical protein [Actinomadura catellatispora]GGT85326.1 hypothetical protein GCM10010208_05250 [Actinomadura livida]
MPERIDLISLQSTWATSPTVVVSVDPASLEGEIVVDTEFVKGRKKISLHSDDIAEWAEVLEALDGEETGSWMEAAGRTVLTIEWDDEYDYLWVTIEDRVGSMATVRVQVGPDEYWLDDQFNRLARFREASPKLSS